MGHVRLGRLPKTRRWRAVVELLVTAPTDVAAVASATVTAAEERLRALADDASLTYAFWLLTRITWAARSPSFAAALGDVGLDPRAAPSTLAFIGHVGDHVRAEARQHPESGPFSELSLLALRRALSETVGQEGGSLFGSSLDDLQHALRQYATPARFGTLAKRFFGDLFARTLRFFVEKELSNTVGAGRALTSVTESRAFAEALDLYVRQTARIMEQYGADWYSKYNWRAHGEISRAQARACVARSLRKLRSELQHPYL